MRDTRNASRGEGGEKGIALLDGSMTSSARPFDKNNMTVRMLECLGILG
jgi:hypothetical protein